MSDLKPKSYFFTALTNSTQSANQAFGPVSGNEATQFRTTAKFTAGSPVSAHAICTGQVFIQPGQSSGTINLILRPYRQPIKGLAIKYFIYRGLDNSDFLEGANNLISHSNLGTASEFMNVIWTQLKKFNDWEDSDATGQNFLAKWIGYDPTNQPAESEIDDYFFAANAISDESDEELKPFEFPIIKQGTHLGNFSGEYGLDIVLSDGDYKPLSSDTGFKFDLAYARASEGIINTQNLPENSTEKQYREAVFNFMDPAAYYGLHYNSGKVSVANGTDDPDVKDGEQIYNDLLDNFATKNNVYIYLQNHLGRSFNYYGNYTNISDTGDVLKTGVALDNMQSAPPTTHSWPLLIQNTVQNHSQNTNTIYLQFAVGNLTPLCFAQIGTINAKAENNFLVADQLLPIQPDPVDGQVAELNIFSQEISLVIPAISGTGDIKHNVASYAKLLYKGANLTATQSVDTNTVVHIIKTLDILFNPIHIESRFASIHQDEISWCISHKTNLVDTSLINEINKSKIVTQAKVIFDKLAYTENDESLVQNRVIYETQLNEGIGKGLFARSNSNTSSDNAGSIVFSEDDNNFYRVSDPYYMQTEKFTNSNSIISGVKLLNLDNVDFNAKSVLGLVAEENEILRTIIVDNSLKSTSIFLLNTLNANSDSYVSNEDVTYKIYLVGVLGENDESKLNVVFPDEDLKIYTIDDDIYFSEDYVKYMPEMIRQLFANQLLPEL
jgi:hypothetical protein